MHRASGYQAVAAEPPSNRSVTDAITELDAWDEPNFRLAPAALLRRNPEQAEFVFAGFPAAAGPAAVLKARKQADAAALKTLAGRGNALAYWGEPALPYASPYKSVSPGRGKPLAVPGGSGLVFSA